MRNINSNKNLITIAVICVCCVIIFAAVVVMMTRGDRNDYTSDAGNDTPVPGGAYVDENDTVIVPEGSDYLPEYCVGNWVLPEKAHVLQSPRKSAISEEEALKQEKEGESVLLAYDRYRTSNVGSVYSPYYKVRRNCGADAMDAVGIQSSGVLEEFSDGAVITRVEVYDQSGQILYDTAFLIDDQYLVYYGTGGFVFAAVKEEAQG